MKYIYLSVCTIALATVALLWMRSFYTLIKVEMALLFFIKTLQALAYLSSFLQMNHFA